MGNRHIHLFNFLIKLKKLNFCTPIIVNISISPTFDRKMFDIQKIFTYSRRVQIQKLDRNLGRM